MIIGSSSVNNAELIKCSKSYDDFLAYCKKLVPQEFRHVDVIINNQCYFCALKLRSCKEVSWEVKKPLCNEVLRKHQICGGLNEIIEVGNLLTIVNIQRLKDFIAYEQYQSIKAYYDRLMAGKE